MVPLWLDVTGISHVFFSSRAAVFPSFISPNQKHKTWYCYVRGWYSESLKIVLLVRFVKFVQAFAQFVSNVGAVLDFQKLGCGLILAQDFWGLRFKTWGLNFVIWVLGFYFK